MEEPALQRKQVLVAQKRKMSSPAQEGAQKLPRAPSCSLDLHEDPDAEQEMEPNGQEQPLSGEALDLSVTTQVPLGVASAGAAQGAPDGEDIGLLNRQSLTHGQRWGILASRWLPPSNFQFPRRLMGSGASQKYRRCSAQLLQDYPFVRYSQHLDGVFCGPCFVFNSNKEAILVSTPLKDWSNSKKILERHSRSKEHGQAVVKTEAFAALERKKQLSERGQHPLKQMVKLILLCGRHDIALGPRPAVAKTLSTLCRYMAELDPLWKESLKGGPCAAPEASEHTLEELIRLTGLQIQSRVLARVKAAGFFSLIVGGSSEPSTKETVSLSLSLRYVHRPEEGPVEIREDPVDFVEASGEAAESLSELFLQRVTAWGLQKELLKGYGHRGGCLRRGQWAGIRELFPEAVCSASAVHQLTTAVIRSCVLRPVTKLLDTLSRISLVLKSSAERLGPWPLALRAFLGDDSNPGEEDEEDGTEKVWGTAGLRHPHLADVLSSFRDEYAQVLEALQMLAEDDGEAERLFYSITKFDFLVTLVCVAFVLSCTKALHLDLHPQWVDADLIRLSEEANLLLQRFRKMQDKEDPAFESLYDDVRLLAAGVGVEESPPLTCGRLASPEAFGTQDLREGYRMSLFILFLDHAISELQEQLLDSCPRFLVQYLIPDKLPLLDGQEAEAAVYEAFRGDLPSLDSFCLELQSWRANWTEVPREDRPSSLLGTLQHLNPVCFPSINAALSILATMPISVPPGERSSRALQRAKIWQRNLGKGNPLTGLALISIHQDIPVDVDQVLGGLHLFTH